MNRKRIILEMDEDDNNEVTIFAPEGMTARESRILVMHAYLQHVWIESE